ncbi:phytoene desaturase family protein [Alphaproteobacteria bacterium]|nr:phytoene desaturase family protein [Alphaproteobacteria bacterium]
MKPNVEDNNKIKSIVIGGGFGGIATALRLKALGHKVTLLEKLDALGGRAQVFNKNGFKHDAGPTVITAPFLFDELFELFNEKREDYIEFKPLDPWYRFHFHNGQTFDYSQTIEKTKIEMKKFSIDDANNYENLLKASKSIFDVGFTKLADKPFNSFFFMLKQIPSLLKLKSYLTVAQLVNKYIKNPNLRAAFSIHPLLVGGNPFSTTSIYALIHFLERNWGVYFSMGGTGKLVNELTNLLKRSGVEIKYNVDIKNAFENNGRIEKLESMTGEIFFANNIVFNGDPPTFYREILKSNNILQKRKKFLPEKLTTYSMGMFVLFFGTKKQYPKIAHHSIWLGKRFKSLLKDIFDNKTLSEDFSLYIHRPTATDKSFAPEGCDSFYVLCPVPNLQGNVDWSKEGIKLQNRIVEALEKTILPELKKNICDDFFMTPIDFKNNYRSTHGAGFSIAPIFSQSAWFRYHNKDPHIKNLFFAAAGAHPGAGVPGVLSSAKIVESLIK